MLTIEVKGLLAYGTALLLPARGRMQVARLPLRSDILSHAVEVASRARSKLGDHFFGKAITQACCRKTMKTQEISRLGIHFGI